MVDKVRLQFRLDTILAGLNEAVETLQTPAILGRPYQHLRDARAQLEVTEDRLDALLLDLDES